MKICLLNVLHEADDKRVFQKIARSLSEAGHAVVSICPDTGVLPEEPHGVQFQFIPAAVSKRQRLGSVWRLIQRGRRVDAEVYYAPEPESWVAALVLKLMTGRMVVFDMHEHVPTEFAKFFPAFAHRSVAWLTVRFMRWFGRWTDYVLLTRESFEPLWEGVRVPRVVVINTNHLQPACAAVPEALRERHAERTVIIHQGIFGDVRGSYQLLEAMKLLVPQFPELCCLVLGRYAYGSEQEYRDAIARAGLTKHFDFPGVVPFDAVPAYIALARVGLILFQPGPVNHTLAMPHKLFDYMREGKPVVAPDFAVEVARIVREADCGLLVDVTQPEAIARAIAQLLEQPEDAAQLGRNGRRLVETKYHWEAEERALLGAFAALEGPR